MLATRELENIKRLSVAKDNHSVLLNDEMVVYHVKTSVINKIHWQKTTSIKNT